MLVSFNYTDAYILNVPEGYRGGAQYAMDDSRINQLTLPQWVDGDSLTERDKRTQAEIQAHLAHRRKQTQTQIGGRKRTIHYTLSARCGAGDATSQNFKCDLDGTRRGPTAAANLIAHDCRHPGSQRVIIAEHSWRIHRVLHSRGQCALFVCWCIA